MYDSVITLVSEVPTIDEYGDPVMTSTSRQVFAELKSIGLSEFYQAQAVGLKPEIKFVIADYLDYNNEETIIYTPYNGTEEVYKVLRTYRQNNSLEIVCKRGIDE